MDADVVLLDTKTGEQRVYRDDRFSEFQWSENNYSCDCNRHLFFARAGGYEATEPVLCGESRFVVVQVRDHLTGDVLQEGDLR